MPQATLFISRAIVRCFRGLSEADIRFEPTTTILVGENNSGKSSILLALATALGKRRGSLDDLLRKADGSASQNASIDLFLSPTGDDGVFTDEVRQRLIAIQREAGSTREIVGFRTVLQPSGEGSLLLDHRRFLQSDANGQWVESPAPPFHSRVLELLEAHLIDASRDLLEEMGVQTSSWGRILSDLGIPDLPDLPGAEPAPNGRRGLELALKEISGRLRAASPVLTRLHSDLGQITTAQATVGRVDLVPLPMRIEELARSMEVILSQQSFPELPLRFHGLGSRSLAALLVFGTMCVLRVGQDQGIKPHLLTLIEEPEAHLHPHAVAALLKTLDDLPGQRVVTTHSPTLVAEAPPAAIRLLRRSAGAFKIRSPGTLTLKAAEKFRRFLGRPFGECFFARLVVFGDGVTERDTLPVLISMGLSADAGGLGITFVDCRSMGNYKNINPVLVALHNLEIPWLLFSDNDAAGLQALSSLKDPQSDAPLHRSHPCVAMGHGTRQTEQLLIDAGYTGEIIAIASDHGQTITTPAECLEFLTSNKAWAPHAVALRAREAGKPCPPHLTGLLSAIRTALSLPAPAPTSTETQ